MTYIALLRGINVGGTGLLSMKDLVRLCEDVGFTGVRTWIQSGNAVFQSSSTKATVCVSLQQVLHAHMGKPVDVMVRTAPELRVILEGNPFPDGKPDKVHIAFLSAAPPATTHGVVGPAGEQVVPGTCELYLYYPEGMGRSKLKLPLGTVSATLRNLNTIAKLVALAEA